MPWGNNLFNLRYNGGYGQQQTGTYPQQSQQPQQQQQQQGFNLFRAPLFNFNSQRQPADTQPKWRTDPYPPQQLNPNMTQRGYMPQQGAYPRQQPANMAPQNPYPQQPAGAYMPRQLPDGVQIQPLNASNMGLLQGLGMGKPVQQPNPAAALVQPEKPEKPVQEPERQEPPKPPEDTEPHDLSEPSEAPNPTEDRKPPEPSKYGLDDALRELIQDERNSSRYYAYMADISTRSAYAGFFRRESESCSGRVDKLRELYGRRYHDGFSPAEPDIYTRVDFNTGVSWAVAVESQALKKYGALYENAPDDMSAKMIFSQVCGKISHIMMLTLIMQNKDVTV